MYPALVTQYFTARVTSRNAGAHKQDYMVAKLVVGNAKPFPLAWQAHQPL